MPEDSQAKPDSQSGPDHGGALAAPAILARDLCVVAGGGSAGVRVAGGSHGGGRVVVSLGEAPLRLESGQISVIIGPNGAGKSSLLKALAGLLPSGVGSRGLMLAGGEVRWHDRPLTALSPRQRAATCVYLSQIPSLSAVMPVEAVVGLGRLALPTSNRGEDARAIQWALDLTGASTLAPRYFHELSAGQQQRVMLARGLCQLWTPQVERSPRFGAGKLLLLDEPASMLDPEQTSAVLRILTFLKAAGVCCACVMHDLISAQHIADQIIMVRRLQSEDVKSPQVVSGPAHLLLTKQAMEDLFSTPFAIARQDGNDRALVIVSH